MVVEGWSTEHIYLYVLECVGMSGFLSVCFESVFQKVSCQL